MPGSIKIDDGSGNYTILTNAGSLGSDKTITIPNETATLATTTATDLGGLVKLSSATASGSSDFTFDNFVDNSTYSYYKLIMEEIVPSVDCQLHFVFRSGGASGADMTGTYRRSGWYTRLDIASSATYGGVSDTDYSRTAFGYGASTNENFSSEVDIYPNITDHLSKITHMYMGKDSTPNLVVARDNVILDNSTAMTGIKIEMSTGNIATGTATLYGVKK